MKKFIAVIISLSCSSLWACEIQKLDALNLAISTEDQKVIPYLGDRPLYEIPYFRAMNCTQTAMNSQFLMVALGPEVVEFDDTIKGVNFTGEFGYKQCELENHPFLNRLSYQQRLENFREDWKLIRSCLDVTVEEEGPQKISLPEKQPGCTVTRLSNHKISFNGGFCFVKPGFGSSYLIKVNVRPECTNLETLKKLNIKKHDLASAINLYAAGDATGNSGNLKALSHTKVRLSVNPLKQLLQTSDDYGANYPVWPETFNAPDIHLGKMVLKSPGNGMIQVEVPLLVDNNCQKKCDANFCQSPCDYAQPVIAEYSLHEMVKGKKELLTTWYDGGIAPAGFQGFIRGINFEIPNSYLEAGKTYSIEAVLTDPQHDFDRFKKRIRNKLNTIDQQLGRISHSGIPSVQEIPSFQQSRLLPTLQGIPNLIFALPFDNVTTAVDQLRSFLSFHLWPPYYTKACAGTLCAELDQGYLNLEVTFKISGGLENEALMYETIKVSRKSKIVSSYERNEFYNPQIKCEFNP